MSQPRPLVDRSPALQLLTAQVVLGCVIGLAALLVSPRAAASVALGAGIALAGSLYFALRAFQMAGGAAASRILQNFYKGEVGKFIITVLLLAVVLLRFKSVQVGWLLTGFILEQLVAFVVHLVATVRQAR